MAQVDVLVAAATALREPVVPQVPSAHDAAGDEAVSASGDALPDPAALAATCTGDGRTLVVAVRDARLVPQQDAWVRALLAAAPTAVLVCLGMPEDEDLSPAGVAVVAARSASAVSTRAAAEALWGAG